MLTIVPGGSDADDPGRPGGSSSLIDQIVREGARRMLAEALQAEVDDYIARFAGERDDSGRRLVVRNGSHQPREVLTSAGAVHVTVPRVNDRRVDPDTGTKCCGQAQETTPSQRRVTRQAAPTPHSAQW